MRGEGRIPLVERRGAAAGAAQPLGPVAKPLQDLELVAAIPATILIERHLRFRLVPSYGTRSAGPRGQQADSSRVRGTGRRSAGVRQVAVELPPELSEIE